MELKNFFPEKENLALIVVDIQDNLLKAFKDEIKDKIIQKASLIIRYFKHKNYPIIVFEQYPKGIGPTNETIKEALGDSYQPIVKNCFSGVCAEGFEDKLSSVNKRDIVLIGIEAHICVLQTCYDLILKGKNVYVPADAVGSRFKVDWQFGLRAMENMSANILSTEILIFKLLEKAGTEDFKFMLPYLK
ncbi:MAG: isochorismatase family protein [Proteobacteria bacterium]|nr:isochorismatase family protein [Pseudomonadota bacterium]